MKTNQTIDFRAKTLEMFPNRVNQKLSNQSSDDDSFSSTAKPRRPLLKVIESCRLCLTFNDCARLQMSSSDFHQITHFRENSLTFHFVDHHSERQEVCSPVIDVKLFVTRDSRQINEYLHS
jgi:hypothetical protein